MKHDTEKGEWGMLFIWMAIFACAAWYAWNNYESWMEGYMDFVAENVAQYDPEGVKKYNARYGKSIPYGTPIDDQTKAELTALIQELILEVESIKAGDQKEHRELLEYYRIGEM